MRFFATLVVTTAFCCNLAQAQDLVNEFLFQAGEKKGYLQIESVGSSTDLVQGSGGVVFRSTSLNLNYEYGFLKNLSVYGGVSHFSGVSEGRIKGIGPLLAGAKYSQNIGPGMFFSRLNVMANVIGGRFSCENTCDPSDSSISGNLQLAYRWTLNNAYTGFSLSYGLFSTDYKTDNGNSEDRKGFLTVTGFYERAINDNLWGLALTYIADGGMAGNNGSMLPFIYNGFHLDNENIDSDAWALKGYLRSNITESIQLITAAEYSRLINADQFSSKSSTMSYSVNLRKLF